MIIKLHNGPAFKISRRPTGIRPKMRECNFDFATLGVCIINEGTMILASSVAGIASRRLVDSSVKFIIRERIYRSDRIMHLSDCRLTLILLLRNCKDETLS